MKEEKGEEEVGKRMEEKKTRGLNLVYGWMYVYGQCAILWPDCYRHSQWSCL